MLRLGFGLGVGGVRGGVLVVDVDVDVVVVVVACGLGCICRGRESLGANDFNGNAGAVVQYQYCSTRLFVSRHDYSGETDELDRVVFEIVEVLTLAKIRSITNQVERKQ